MAALWTIYYFKLVNITNVLNEIKTKKYITHCMKSVHIRFSFHNFYLEKKRFLGITNEVLLEK